jgi:pyridoxine 4-dehydrogenase
VVTTTELRDAVTAGGTLTIGGDLTVHRVGFGTLQLCGPNGWGQHADPANARAVLRAAVDAGIDLLDTADAYGPHVAEELIAEVLHPYPPELVIATKGGQVRSAAGRYFPLGRPEYLRQCVELSLRRLRLERIDLYQLHRIDPTVPLEDQFGLLGEMQAEGKIRHIGLSEVSADELERIREVVEVVSVQNRYNVADRTHEPLRLRCEQLGLAFLPWFPLDNGALGERDGPLWEIATRHDATTAQIALAWVLRHSPNTVLIAGTSSLEHLAANVLAAQIVLDAEELAVLDALGEPAG